MDQLPGRSRHVLLANLHLVKEQKGSLISGRSSTAGTGANGSFAGESPAKGSTAGVAGAAASVPKGSSVVGCSVSGLSCSTSIPEIPRTGGLELVSSSLTTSISVEGAASKSSTLRLRTHQSRYTRFPSAVYSEPPPAVNHQLWGSISSLHHNDV